MNLALNEIALKSEKENASEWVVGDHHSLTRKEVTAV
jgi:hypothetical protein